MNYDAQSLIVHGLTLLSSAWICRAIWRTFRAKHSGGCGSCPSGGCGAKSAEPSRGEAPPVFTLLPPR